MAAPINGCVHWEIEFDATGGLVGDDGLVAAMGQPPLTDLFVFGHGWNSSPRSARELSDVMFSMVADQLPPATRANVGFVTLLWPALVFPEDDPTTPGPVAGAVSSGADLAGALAPVFPEQKTELSRIGLLLDTRPQDPDRLGELHRLVSGLVSTPNDAPEDDGESTARTAPTRQVLELMAGLAPNNPDDAQPVSGFDGLWDGGRELLRVLSYYEMKNRAGVIGRAGLGPLLGRLGSSVRVHLMGHSFGARLVSFALAGLPKGAATPVRSLLLVQAAFSHFAFAPRLPFAPARLGALAGIGDRVAGPLAATFTAADRALGWWYPNASRLARQDDQAANDFGFRWGALGHDGFQQDGPLDRVLRPVGGGYDWLPGAFYRLDANLVINRNQSAFSGAHSDIRKPEIAWAAVTAAGLRS